MPVGAAIGVGSVVGGGISALGAKSAAKTQANAAQDAAALQAQMFQQTRGDLAPFRAYGQSALSPLAQLLGLQQPGGGYEAAGTPGGGSDLAGYLTDYKDVAAEYSRLLADPAGRKGLADMGIGSAEDFANWHYQARGQGEGRAMRALTGTPGTAVPGGGGGATDIQAFLETLPGYKFAKDQGIRAVTNAVGSRGLTGARAKGIARFVTGLADSTYGDQVNRLSSAATIGANAAATTGTLSGQASNSIGNSLIGAGTASAAGTVGASNAISGAVGNITNYLAANKFLGMYGGAGSSGGAG